MVNIVWKADDFSHLYLSNLTFWKFISFYVKDYPKQESIKIHMYLFYVTFHNMLMDKKTFTYQNVFFISHCILQIKSDTVVEHIE